MSDRDEFDFDEPSEFDHFILRSDNEEERLIHEEEPRAEISDLDFDNDPDFGFSDPSFDWCNRGFADSDKVGHKGFRISCQRNGIFLDSTHTGIIDEEFYN